MRWSSWGDGTLQFWSDSVTVDEIVPTGRTGLRGMDRATDGSFWLVDVNTNEIVHTDPTGSVLSTFASPAITPQGISYRR
jgi:hypothetical protein